MSVIYTMFIFVMFWNSTVLRVNTLILGVNTPTCLIFVSVIILLTTLSAIETVKVGNMTTMVSISQNKEPMVPKGIKCNLEQMGLFSKATLQGGLTTQANNADACNEARSDRNMWSIALTIELLSTICQEGKVVPTNIPGNLMMPNWDKVVFSPTPTEALMNLFFHAAELHMQTQHQSTVHMPSFEASNVQMKLLWVWDPTASDFSTEAIKFTPNSRWSVDMPST